MTTKTRQRAFALTDSECDEHSALVEAYSSEVARINELIAALNDTQRKIKEFAERVHDRLSDEFEDKSEVWQEGEKGQTVAAWIEEWKALSEAEEVDEVADLEVIILE